MATDQMRITEEDREPLVRCTADAFEALKMIPGIDANGPILVWLSDQFLQLQRKRAAPPRR